MSAEPNLYGTLFGTEEHEARMRAAYRRRAARLAFPSPPSADKKNKKDTK